MHSQSGKGIETTDSKDEEPGNPAILFIDTGKELKEGRGWQLRVAEHERLQAEGYSCDNRTRL